MPGDRLGRVVFCDIRKRLIIGKHEVGGRPIQLRTGVHQDLRSGQIRIPHRFGVDIPEREPQRIAFVVLIKYIERALVVIHVTCPVLPPEPLVAGRDIPLHPRHVFPDRLRRRDTIPIPDGDMGKLDQAVPFLKVLLPGNRIGVLALVKGIFQMIL